MIKFLSIVLVFVQVAAGSSWERAQEKIRMMSATKFAQHMKPFKDDLQAAVNKLPQDAHYWEANAHQIALEAKLIVRGCSAIFLDSSKNLQAIHQTLIEAAHNGSLKNLDQCITLLEGLHKDITQKIETFLVLESNNIVLCKQYVEAIINFMKNYQRDLYASLHAIESMPLNKQMLDELVQASQANLEGALSVKKIDAIKGLLYSELFDRLFDTIEEILQDAAFYEFLKNKKDGHDVTYQSPTINILGTIGISLFSQFDMIARS
jgi:isochorismate synthase EntC